MSDVSFFCNGEVGKMILDTGAGITVVSEAFAAKSKLSVRALPAGSARTVRVADGTTVSTVGVVDLPMMVQLMLTEEDGVVVHWDRCFTLRNVHVLPLGDEAPRDLYVSYGDWAFGKGGDPDSPWGVWRGWSPTVRSLWTRPVPQCRECNRRVWWYSVRVAKTRLCWRRWCLVPRMSCVRLCGRVSLRSSVARLLQRNLWARCWSVPRCLVRWHRLSARK